MDREDHESKLAVPIARAATILRTSCQVVHRLIKDGLLETTKSWGGSRLVTIESINVITRKTGVWRVTTPKPAIQVVMERLPKFKKAEKEEPSPSHPMQIVIEEEPPWFPPQPVDGNSSHLLRTVPGTDAVPRACSQCGGLYDRRDMNFVCISCGNTVSVYEERSVR